ncbi:tRNA-dihydrouridine(47) synthase [NAD(P)(+)] [Leptodontidium sp. 2 PMI_412]|nr:tRNA-dihydrouridine(47) synthase [NAD(P)(+)] [Leptodontidium sp. 2 PMI_412]
MTDNASMPQDLKRSFENESKPEYPPQTILPEDSTATKIEKAERNGTTTQEASEEPAAKRVKMEQAEGEQNGDSKSLPDSRDKIRGVAMVKQEYLIDTYRRGGETANPVEDDDAAEGRLRGDDRDNNEAGGKKNKKNKKKKEKGQNKGREFGSWYDAIRLCNSRATSNEFSPKHCDFGDSCKCSHDLRQYLKDGKREDLTNFEGKCPVWEVYGICHAGWKCRFVGNHSEEIKREDGRMELVLTYRDGAEVTEVEGEDRKGVYNVVGTKDKLDLARRRFPTDKAETYTKWLDEDQREMEKVYHKKKHETEAEAREENRAQFKDPPLLPSEKRRIYFGPETPVLAPLTTQGNLPFRRMCVEFGAQLTYSEMAMSTPLIQGQKSEWALMKAHESEISPPRYTPTSIVQGYDNSKDLKFGTQISASKPWQAVKAAEVMSKLLPNIRLMDLNCGCPIEMVYQSGAGSGLLDAPSKLEKMIRGMNTVSGDVPVTAKIRMGTKTEKPTALKIIDRLAFGGFESRDRLGAPGCAAITLHGRSRQQRYTKTADWTYIAECGVLIKAYNKERAQLADTAQEPDERTQANSKDGKMFFIGNGDCYSHVDYLDHIQKARVDSVMIARGALIKPWIFEEIEQGQYLDKTASQRLGYVEKFVKYGLEAWGSDEVGVGQTRRFLLEWLSFAHRYVPVGILAHLPPSLQDRPPAYRGRDDMETLLASDNYLDWIKISEMYLGPAHKDFKFQPKHKSNSYEIEAEG